MAIGDELDVIVVGAGLAGLAAGAAAAGEGLRVLVVDAHHAGGRARTTTQGPARFNQGPHALYRGGAAEGVLASLGVAYDGGPPLTGAGRALVGDRLEVLPVGGSSLLRTGLFGARAKVELGRLLAGLARIDVEPWRGRPFAAFLDEHLHHAASRQLVAMLARVSTYVADPLTLPADLVLGQLKLAASGVLYLHDGWQSLVDGLAARVAPGGAVQPLAEVVAVTCRPGSYEVTTGSGVHRARALVVAAGGPDTAARLLGRRPDGWTGLGPAVVASCLDLATDREPDPPVIFGFDAPLYLSSHCPPARLAPAGTSVVHVARYGEPVGPPADGRSELQALAVRAGLTAGHVVEERYLHRMVVAHVTPGIDGLAARPPVAVPGADGLFVAGDWVGPVGWLADASLASGHAAGLLAAAHAQSPLAV